MWPNIWQVVIVCAGTREIVCYCDKEREAWRQGHLVWQYRLGRVGTGDAAKVRVEKVPVEREV